jgi:hypothetical protein
LKKFEKTTEENCSASPVAKKNSTPVNSLKEKERASS